MIKIRTVTMKNFLSVGNTTQAITLDEHGLTLILGENVDLGSAGSRNGVGKTTLIQAICYAIYGQPLTSIKKDNLVNKTNQKAMTVSLDFEVGNKTYRIERGRKPNFLRFYVNDGLVNAEGTDEAHGESKVTQEEIEKVIGCSHLLFKHIVALHSKTVPFLDMSAKDQREVIEELLGITQLSSKADQLKDLVKQIKDEIKGEEIRIKTVKDSNEKIQKTINELNFKSKMWDKEHMAKLLKLEKAIDQMNEIDIEAEINNQRLLVEFNRLSAEVMRFERDAVRVEKTYNSLDSNINRIDSQLAMAEQNKCHTCGQDVHDDKHAEILKDLLDRKAQLVVEREAVEVELTEAAGELEKAIGELTQLGPQPSVNYDTMEQALNHRHTLDKLLSDITREAAVESPYLDQIANLSTSGIQDVSYEYLNELVRLKEHQDFLVKLLTDKNSFIRKKIIDQNLSYLNVRLNSYLDKIQLPHEVAFQSDLSVEITLLGKEYDFAQLSNGEANRLVLALAWSFRDVWETMNKPMNLLMIDELVDSGMDSAGMDLALEILKKMSRERGKNVFLISHNDSLTSRVPRILLVQKENNFTTFVTDTEAND
jgi:DNA repair exonuclease SbcCD ATPase subunit